MAKKTDTEKAGNTEVMISTGSTLLDLAISGKRVKGGGLPGGIFIEIFGPNGSGKTVLLCELGGNIQRHGGDLLFNDPEARLNESFAQMFDLNTAELTIQEPDTVTEMIAGIKDWEPEPSKKDAINGIITDSLAALSTNIEMDNEEGDKMGMRRAKEFSEGLRKICRLLKQSNYIMAASNQIRDNADAVGYGEKFSVPGGKAIGFYASVRLRVFPPEKIKKKKSFKGKEYEKVIGIKSRVQVYKNSVDEPYREAPVYILFDYGIDDIRANLQYLKDTKKTAVYTLGERNLDKSLDKSVDIIEKEELEQELRAEVIEMWEGIEMGFTTSRKKKTRI